MCFNMGAKFYVVSFVFCWAISLIKSESDCTLNSDKRIGCERLNLSISKPLNKPVIEYGNQIDTLSISFCEGSVGVKTLSTFPEVERLFFTFCEIKDFEKGALCSLQKLKTLSLWYSQLPLLTREHFSGCNHLEQLKLEYFSEENSLGENTFEEMSGLQSLYLTTLKFSKAYIAPLKKLTHLDVQVGMLSKIEPGSFCLPTLEYLLFHTVFQTEITESLFEGCSNIKEMNLLLYKGVIPERQNPFSNLTHLESLRLEEIIITHLTKDFLSGLPNLKAFTIILSEMKKKLSIDYDSFIEVPNVTQLNLDGVGLNDSDLERLNFPSSLEQLSLHYNEIKNIDVLKSLPKLRSLSLMHNKIVRFNLAALKKNFPKLETITLYENPLDINFANELKKEKTLKFQIDYEKLGAQN